MVLFGHTAIVSFLLNAHKSNKAVKDSIMNLKYGDIGGTNIARGMNMALDQVYLEICRSK